MYYQYNMVNFIGTGCGAISGILGVIAITISFVEYINNKKKKKPDLKMKVAKELLAKYKKKNGNISPRNKI